jgi:hypothetical protein
MASTGRRQIHSSLVAHRIVYAGALGLLISLIPEARAVDHIFDGVIDLANLDGTNGFAINGINPGPGGSNGDNAGWSVSSAGDFNNDGFSDLLISAPSAWPNGIQYAGESYVVYGGTGVGAGGTLNLSSLNGSNGFVLRGVLATEGVGVAVSRAGDINADGVDDIVVSGQAAVITQQARTAKAYILFGGMGTGANGVLSVTNINGTNGFIVDGIGMGAGSHVPVSSAGDLNADGVDDLMIGESAGARVKGLTHVIFGKAQIGASGPIQLSSLNGLNGFTIEGITQYDLLGTSVGHAGDVNADGVDDIVIGAPQSFRIPYRPGESYVLFGGSGIGGTGAFSPASLNGANGYTVRGINMLDFAGSSVSGGGDYNNDGVDDFLVGAATADPNGLLDAGESYVVFGGSAVGASGTINLSSLNGANGFKVRGLNTGDSAAGVANAGDINGDRVADFAVAAYGADPNGHAEAGQVYVVYGGTALGASGTLDLSTLNGINGFVANGIDANGLAGLSVSNAGDVNGDGVDDLIIGAPNATANGNITAGQSYVVFGARRPPPGPVTVSGLRGFDVISPPGMDVNDFHITLHGVTDPLNPGSQIANIYPLPGTTPSNLPPGWYPPTTQLLPGGHSTEVAYGGTSAPMVLNQRLHFGVELTPHGESLLDAICAHWTRNGVPIYEGNDPNIPITIYVDNPGPGESPIQLINQICPDHVNTGTPRWVGPIHFNVVDQPVNLADLHLENRWITTSSQVTNNASFMAAGGSMTLPFLEAIAQAAPGNSILIWYDVFADANGTPGQLVGTSFTVFNIAAVPEPHGLVLLSSLLATLAGYRRRRIRKGDSHQI